MVKWLSGRFIGEGFIGLVEGLSVKGYWLSGGFVDEGFSGLMEGLSVKGLVA
jgi:hypothetical protein